MSVEVETLRRPEEVLNDDRMQYQAMTEFSEEEYERLADDIRERGVLQPIITDETGTIIDGHHRAALAEQLDLDESRQPAYVVLGDLDGDDEKLARAIKQNVLGRDTGDAVKTHAVKQYIETAWDRTDGGDLIRPETDTQVADKLGVSQELVTDVVNRSNGTIIDHDRVKARRYYEENPDASYREVARQVDSAKATVTKWLKEDFDEGDDGDEEDDDTSLAAFARDGGEAEKVMDVVETASDDEADDQVRETAQEKAEEITQGRTTPDDAAFEVDQAEREREEQEEKQQQREDFECRERSDGTVSLYHRDFRELNGELDGVDHIITDPPYDEDALELWDGLGELAADVLPPGGFLVAYSGKAHLPAVHATLSNHLNYYWQAVVRHGGAGAKIFSRKLRTNYKPVVVYQKGDLQAQSDFASDVIEGAGREKGDHDWQQAEAEAAELVETFSDPNETILDPMCGSGTTGVACQRLKRQCILVDRDEDAIHTAREKVVSDE
jgi:ParB-like chromosome segregation protein Spo0J